MWDNWCETLLLDVTGLEPDETLLSRLSPLRQAKVRAYSHEAGRRLSLGAGLLLDHALRRHGLRECDVAYSIGRHGKPEIAHTSAEGAQQLHFNLSHSGTMVACAIASCPVGVDVEKSSRRVTDALLRRVCSEAQQEEVRRDPLRFFDLWTAKEALVKMTGEGLSGDLRTLDTSCVHSLRLPSGYALAVAASGKCTFSLPEHVTLRDIAYICSRKQ